MGLTDMLNFDRKLSERSPIVSSSYRQPRSSCPVIVDRTMCVACCSVEELETNGVL